MKMRVKIEKQMSNHSVNRTEKGEREKERGESE